MVDPIVLQIVEGTLHSIEAEVEAAIERTARSPMIRDQHDYRAGIHDARCRKLTGRSYSAMVQPVVRDFPLESMCEGDVFYHNDVYLSEGSVGHLPDLTTTVPVFHEGRVEDRDGRREVGQVADRAFREVDVVVVEDVALAHALQREVAHHRLHHGAVGAAR